MPSGGGSSTTTTVQQLSPEQRQLIDPVIPIAKDYLKNPLELFPGSTVAPPTELQTEGRQSILDAAQGPLGEVTDQALGTVARGQDFGLASGSLGIGQLLSRGAEGAGGTQQALSEFADTRGSRDFLTSGALLDPATNPVLAAQTSAAIDPIFGRLMEDVLPRIDNQYATTNMFGSSRQGIAQGSAIEDALSEAGDVATELQANNFNRGLDAMTQASLASQSAGLDAGRAGIGASTAAADQGLRLALETLTAAPELGSLAFLPGRTMEAVGAMEQQQNQAVLSEEANRYLTEQMLPFLQAQDVAGLAFGFDNGSSVATSSTPGPDPLSQGLGALLMAPFPFL